MKLASFLLGSAALALSAVAASAQSTTKTYAGNLNTGFGGNIGNGMLTVASDAAGNLTFTVAQSGTSTAFLNGNTFVLYIDSVAGGFTNTSTFMDNNDGSRIDVSGYYLNNPNNSNTTTQTIATFANGFGADYAIYFDGGNANLFKLASGGNLSLQFIANQSETNAAAGTASITFPSGDIALPQNGTFSLVGNEISGSAFRSDESIGSANAAGNPGFNGGITFAGSAAFTIPEPSTYLFMGLGTVALLALTRHRTHRA